jgi:hypothetical protein
MSSQKKLSKILSNYQPHPGPAFYQRMEQAPWNEKKTKMKNRSSRLAGQFAIGIILVLVVLSLTIPSVRASLSAWLGISVAPSNQIPAQAVTLAVISSQTPAPTSLPSSVQTSAEPTQTTSSIQIPHATSVAKPDEINQMAMQAGWDILVATHLPDGYKYQSAYLDTNHQMVMLTYLATRPLPGAKDPSLTASKTITLLEAQKNDFVPMQIAPTTNVQDIQVNGQPAVYVVGAWDAQFVKDDNDPNGGKMVSTWRNDLQIQNIYWQVGKVYLVLVTDDETVSQQDLIDMASGLR